MSEELLKSLEGIEIVNRQEKETTADNSEGSELGTDAETVEGMAEESTEPDSSVSTDADDADGEDKSLDELPLPGDEEKPKEGDKKNWFDKKLARKQREIEEKSREAEMLREQLARLQQPNLAQVTQFQDPNVPQNYSNDIKREDFANESDYIRAVVRSDAIKEQQLQAQQQQQHALAQAELNFHKSLSETRERGLDKYEDFDEVVRPLFQKDFPTNRAMAEAVVDSEFKDDILYFLGKYKDKAAEIAKLNPVQAVKRIAEIESRFNERKKATVSKAPSPITPIKSNQVKGDLVTNLMDLDKVAKMTGPGAQKAFEDAVNKLNAKNASSGF